VKARYGAPASSSSSASTVRSSSGSGSEVEARLISALKDTLTGSGAAGTGAAGSGAAGGNGANSMACDLCNSAAEYVHEALKNNQTVEEIEEVRAGGAGAALQVEGVGWGGLGG